MDWRECGIGMVPEQKSFIESAVNSVDLWVGLQLECESAFKSGDLRLPKKIFDFAWYCLRSTDTDVSSMTAVAFYEHVPKMPTTTAQLIDLLTESQVEDLAEVFKYHLNPIEHQRFLHEFRQHWKALSHNERKRREAGVSWERTDIQASASDPVEKSED